MGLQEIFKLAITTECLLWFFRDIIERVHTRKEKEKEKQTNDNQSRID
jgi:Na+/H+ antiporter NhaD/arsenite permease-like protein